MLKIWIEFDVVISSRHEVVELSCKAKNLAAKGILLGQGHPDIGGYGGVVLPDMNLKTQH